MRRSSSPRSTRSCSACRRARSSPNASFFAKVGAEIELEELTRFLARNAYSRTGTVREPGEFAPRGGILDLWPPGAEEPLGSISSGVSSKPSAASMRNRSAPAAPRTRVSLLPATETPLDPEAISRFRAGYVAAFGAVTDDDPLYEAISAGRKHAGQEHWLPLFHPRLDTLFDYTGRAVVFLGPQIEGARKGAHRADRGLLRHARILAHRKRAGGRDGRSAL